MHLILPLAASHLWPDRLPSVQDLPHLGRLLGQMQRKHTLVDEEGEHPLLPHERVQARDLGWPDAGPWPQAAQDTGLPGLQAWMTPCHWQVGMDTVVMLPPEALQLGDDESQQLLLAMQAWLQQDGLQVQWHSALRWHARSPQLDGMCTASLARVSGANIRPWLMGGNLPPALRRLQSEMQMLLYNHPVNDARMARGQLTVNSFWLHGAGHPAPVTAAAGAFRRIDALQEAATQGPLAWQQAWQTLDAQVLAPLVHTDTPLQLSLCSESTAHTWQRSPQGWTQRLRRLLQPVRADAALRALLNSSDTP